MLVHYTHVIATSVAGTVVTLRAERQPVGVVGCIDASYPSASRRCGKPTARPTLRWLFQCFESLDLHHLTFPDGTRPTQVLRLNAVDRQVLHLLGPAYEICYLVSDQTAK
jgi:hypothetical protein